LLTHTIPMFFVYIWIWLLLIGWLPLLFMSGDGGYATWPRVLCTRIFVFTFVTLFFQMTTNYAVLFYSKESYPYMGVINDEYQLRNTACYLKRCVDSLASAFEFLSFI